MTYFTNENHPELMSTPLKGAMLQEFIEMIKDMVDTERRGIAKNAQVLEVPEFQDTMAVCKRIVELLTAKIDNASAKSFGLDANDIAAIVYKATGAQANDDATEVNVIPMVERGSDGTIQPIKIDPVAHANQMMGMVMNKFSLCLAVQEGKQEALLKLNEENLKNQRIHTESLPFSGGDMQMQANVSIAVKAEELVIIEQFHRQMKARNSLVLSLYEQVVYGKDYPRTRQKKGYSEALDHTIEVLAKYLSDDVKEMNVDSDTEAGRQKIREFRNNVLTKVREIYGIISREID